MHKIKSKIRVGITMGDPSGIGPSITALALEKVRDLAEFVVIGDKWVFEESQRPKGVPSDRRESRATEGSPERPKGVPREIEGRSRGAKPRGEAEGKSKVRFIDLKNVARKNFAPGKLEAEYGRASIEYLDKALELIRDKEIECLVTCPISKEAISKAGFPYSGHTEYFAQRTQRKDIVMMLLNQQLKFSLATRHIPLKDVSSVLNSDNLYKTIFSTHQALKNLFSLDKPRIVVCGLNPHASDNGIIGEEENRLIKPVLNKLRLIIKDIDGPLSADVAIFKAKEKKYDCVIAIYHDQALIPLKLSGADSAVNMTLGLPFIRTSPLHGTAFDIAASLKADPRSLIAAIKLAIKCRLNLKKA